MAKKVFMVAILPLVASLGCSKPAPPPAPIRPVTQQDLKKLSQPANDAQKNFAAEEKLYEELSKAKARTVPAPPEKLDDIVKKAEAGDPAAQEKLKDELMKARAAQVPATVTGRPVASLDELSALIQKAGYTAQHYTDSNKIAFFTVPSNPSLTKLGFPNGMRILYFLADDKKSFTFFALIRTLRESEGNDVSQAIDNKPFAPALLAKLKTVNPMPRESAFMATTMPAGSNTVVKEPFLILAMSTGNENVDPGTVKTEVDNIVMVLGATKEVWK